MALTALTSITKFALKNSSSKHPLAPYLYFYGSHEVKIGASALGAWDAGTPEAAKKFITENYGWNEELFRTLKAVKLTIKVTEEDV